MAGTVTVGCKLPHGLVLQLQEMRTYAEPSPSDPGRTVQRAVRVGKTVTIKGFAYPLDRGERRPELSGGFALTSGVDKDFFDQWMKQNATHPAVENGFIFGSEKVGEVRNHAESEIAGMSGFEPVDPRNLPAEFRAIETAVA